MPKFAVIVPAAGAGTRFGARGNKIFQRLGEQPVFIRSLELFTSRDDVCDVQLVVSAADLDEVKTRFGGHLGFMSVRLTQGGATRAQSVRNALALVPADAEFVCVHDAVRPCVAQAWVDAVFAQAVKSGAAILACPLHGTLKKVSPAGAPAPGATTSGGTAPGGTGAGGAEAASGGAEAGVILRTVPRDSVAPSPRPANSADPAHRPADPAHRQADPALPSEELWEAQTPQVFRKDLLLQAYEGDLSAATDDAMLVEAAGHPVRVVRGDPRNIKITTPADLAFAAAVIGTLPKPKPKGPSHPFEEARW